MRQAIAVIVILSFAICYLSFAALAAKDPPDFPIKKIYAQASEKSEVVYEIPIEVKLLDVSRDANWYKVKIAFDLGILGKYSYVGWIQIPVGDILAGRETQKLASKK